MIKIELKIIPINSAEASEVGGSWAKMTDVGALCSEGIADREWIKRFEAH